MKPDGRLGLEAADGITVVGAGGGAGGAGGVGGVGAEVVMAEVEVGQCREGGATTSRSTTTSARRSWGGSDGRSCLGLGAGAGAGACVDASRCPSWHSVVIWSGAAVSGLEERAVQRKAVGGTRRQSHGRV